MVSSDEDQHDVPDGGSRGPELAADVGVAHVHPREVGERAEAVEDDALAEPQVELAFKNKLPGKIIGEKMKKKQGGEQVKFS